MTVFTVGHGTRSVEELAAILRAAGVGRLVDVRRFPGSRRHPHLAREALVASLPPLGIEYAWRGDVLGGRRRAIAASRHPAWRVEAFRAYADYMDTPAFRAALGELEADAQRSPPMAVMCAETLWWRCHRRLIADALTVDGHEVIHLLSEKARAPHELSKHLRVDDEGRPVYDLGESLELPVRPL
jgi:uncharacterized protein (DUF488 family)